MNHHRHADANLVPLSLSLSLVDEVTSREEARLQFLSTCSFKY